MTVQPAYGFFDLVGFFDSVGFFDFVDFFSSGGLHLEHGLKRLSASLREIFRELVRK